MNRLQKKCFVASAGVHLLLAVILLIGPGFLPSKNSQDDLPLLTFVPQKTVDELMSGGGDPKAQNAPLQPIPQPPKPQPQPQPQLAAQPPPLPIAQPETPKVRDPDPPKDTKPIKEEEASVEPVKPRKVEISTKLVTRPKDSASERRAKEEAAARQEAKAQADARNRLARQIGKVADHIAGEVSGGTAVEMFKGPGGGGPAYANFYEAVKSVYDRAWLLPDGAIDGDAVTVASVTIARDGTVVSHRITRPSGDSAVDHSVQIALDRVTYAAPLPDSCRENTRTVSIKFSVQAKRSIG